MIHINGVIQYVAVCVWLLSLNVFSRFIHVLNYLLLLNNIVLYGYILFHSPIMSRRTFMFFSLLADMNNAVMNIHVYVFM